ncbi:MAG TPA: hypothetical protein ENK21_06950 [Trueperaceae bacterium]|nr:hypothetical protein [Trueperaceae bacterium]
MLVADLKNIGPKTASSLNTLGIFNLADIERHGIVNVYLALKRLEPKTNLNTLWALQAACLDISWLFLAKEIKEKLLLELDSYHG